MQALFGGRLGEFQASGTEPVVRIYAEANDPHRLQEILNEAIAYAEGGGNHS